MALELFFLGMLFAALLFLSELLAEHGYEKTAFATWGVAMIVLLTVVRVWT